MSKYIYKLEASSPSKMRVSLWTNNLVNEVHNHTSFEFDYTQEQDSNSTAANTEKFYDIISNLGHVINNKRLELTRKKSTQVEWFARTIYICALMEIVSNINYTKSSILSPNQDNIEITTHDFIFKTGRTRESDIQHFEYISLVKEKDIEKEIDLEPINKLIEDTDKRIKELYNIALLTSLPGQIYLSHSTKDKVNLIKDKINFLVTNVKTIHPLIATSKLQARGIFSIAYNPAEAPPLIMPENFIKMGYEYITKAKLNKDKYVQEVRQLRDIMIQEVVTSQIHQDTWTRKYTDRNKNPFINLFKPYVSSEIDALARFYYLLASDLDEKDQLNYYLDNYGSLVNYSMIHAPKMDKELLNIVCKKVQERITSHKLKDIIEVHNVS